MTRTISVSKASGGYLLTATLPENATRWDVSAALIELNRLDPFIEGSCPGCGVAIGEPGAHFGMRNGSRVHALGCPLAPPDFLDNLTAEMEAAR